MLLLCGIFFILLYFYLNMGNPEAASDLLSFLIVGILLELLTVPSMLLNLGAYIHIGDNTLKAKYHWFGKLDCSIDDIEFVFPQINTLTILLKSGKRHVIMGVENSWALSSAIRRQSYAVETEAPDALRQKLALAQAARQKELCRALGGMAMLFVNIFIAVLLTGGRDLHEFTRQDWILFSVMGGVELLTVIGLFYLAQRCGMHLLPIEQLRYRLQGAIIATHPLPSNNITAVYTDENNAGRIVVCGFPSDDGVYYCVEEIYGNYALETIHTSDIYESAEELPGGEFSSLIDISGYW